LLAGCLSSLHIDGQFRRIALATVMTLCPSDEKLASLLADALVTAERDALSEHIERCESCQQKLAHLSEDSNAVTWQPAAHPDPHGEAEEEMVERLKLARSLLA